MYFYTLNYHASERVSDISYEITEHKFSDIGKSYADISKLIRNLMGDKRGINEMCRNFKILRGRYW